MLKDVFLCFYISGGKKLIKDVFCKSICFVNTLRTGLLNCLNAHSGGLIQSEVRFL